MSQLLMHTTLLFQSVHEGRSLGTLCLCSCDDRCSHSARVQPGGVADGELGAQEDCQCREPFRDSRGEHNARIHRAVGATMAGPAMAVLVLTFHFPVIRMVQWALIAFSCFALLVPGLYEDCRSRWEQDYGLRWSHSSIHAFVHAHAIDFILGKKIPALHADCNHKHYKNLLSKATAHE